MNLPAAIPGPDFAFLVESPIYATSADGKPVLGLDGVRARMGTARVCVDSIGAAEEKAAQKRAAGFDVSWRKVALADLSEKQRAAILDARARAAGMCSTTG